MQSLCCKIAGLGAFHTKKMAIFLLLLPGPYYFKCKTSLFYKVLVPACFGERGLVLRTKKLVTRLLVKQLSERLVILFLLLKYLLIHLAGFLPFL